jgi:hypothetical protein
MGVVEAAIYRKVSYSGMPAFDRGCNGKIQHATEASARRHAKKLRKLRKKHYNVYTCSFCLCYHVGSVRSHRRRSWEAD